MSIEKNQKPNIRTTVLGMLLIVTGVALVVSVFVFPAQTNSAYYSLKNTIDDNMFKITNPDEAAIKAKKNPENLPTIILGDKGGAREVDSCSGAFVEMEAYRSGLDIPWYSAHNNCNGQNILPLQMGDEFLVEGQGKYVVTDFKEEYKEGTFVSDLVGIKGEIILQTCYWNSDLMKIIAAEPVV